MSLAVAKSAPGNALILVVDDEPVSRLVAQRILIKKGYQVALAANGQEALIALEKLCPDVIILDYMMPGMDGPAVLAEIRKQEVHRRTPVLLLTSSNAEEHVARAFRAGAQDFITRPVDWRVVSARINAALELSAARKAAREAQEMQSAFMADLYEARQVQGGQLPCVPAEWPGWRATGVVVPSGTIGGDVFAFAECGDTGKTLALVDVCGHGIAAALVASRILSELRASLAGRGPADGLAVLNQRLESMGAGRYAAIALIETHADHVKVVNAGLPPVVQVRDGRVISQVAASGVPPGLLDEQKYEEVALHVMPGDRFLLVSDGLTEPFGHGDDSSTTLEAMGLIQSDATKYWDRMALEGLVRTRLGRVQPDDAAIIILARVPPEFLPIPETRVLRTYDACIATVRLVVQWIMSQIMGAHDETLVELGVTESVTNAVVHGALGVGSDERVGEGEVYLSSAGKVAQDGLTVELRQNQKEMSLNLSWVGTPCPPEYQKAPQASEDLFAESGRGTRIIHSVFDDVIWSDDGLSVDLTYRFVSPDPSTHKEKED